MNKLAFTRPSIAPPAQHLQFNCSASSSPKPFGPEKTPKTTSRTPFSQENNDFSEKRQQHRSAVKLKCDFLFTQRQEDKLKGISQREQRRLQGLANFLQKPGTTRWLGTAAGNGLNQLKDSLPLSKPCSPLKIPDWDPLNGYTGPPFTSQPNVYVPKHPRDAYFTRNCLKLSPRDDLLTVNHALTYLMLRDKGCPKEAAMKFSSKQRCAIDSTQTYDGPVNNRVITRANNSAEGVVNNGWQFHPPEYMFSSEYKKYKPVELYEEYERLIQRFGEFEEKYRIERGELVEANCGKIQINHPEFPSIEQDVKSYSEAESGDVFEESAEKPDIVRENYRNKGKSKTTSYPSLIRKYIKQPKPDKKTIVTDYIDCVIQNSNKKIEFRSIKPVRQNNFTQQPPVCVLQETNENTDNKDAKMTPKQGSAPRTALRSVQAKQEQHFAKYRQYSLSPYDIMHIQLVNKFKIKSKKTKLNIQKSQERKICLDKQRERLYRNQHEERTKLRLSANERREEIHRQHEMRKQEKDLTYSDKIRKMRGWKESEEQGKKKHLVNYMENKDFRAKQKRKLTEQQQTERFNTRKSTREFSVELARFLTKY